MLPSAVTWWDGRGLRRPASAPRALWATRATGFAGGAGTVRGGGGQGLGGGAECVGGGGACAPRRPGGGGGKRGLPRPGNGGGFLWFCLLPNLPSGAPIPRRHRRSAHARPPQRAGGRRAPAPSPI